MHDKLGVFVLFFLYSAICCGEEPLPQIYLDKVGTTPDFCQGDERFGKLPGSGDAVCGPAALSNALVWLDSNGFPKLIAKAKPTLADQADLVRQLCKDEFLGTSDQTGTAPKQMVAGIERFITSAGYDCQIEQMSWRSTANRIGKVPDRQWMLMSSMGASSVLLNIGWYKTDNTGYERVAGHWMTLVGFKEEGGQRLLYVHDPANRDGIAKKTVKCQLIELPSKQTLRLQSGDSVIAKGFFQLKGVAIKQGSDLAIVDCAVAFKPAAR